MAVKRIYFEAGDARVLFYRNQNITCFIYFCLFSNVLDILINNWLLKDWRFVRQELFNVFLTCELLWWQRTVKETIEVKKKQKTKNNSIRTRYKNLRHGLEKNRHIYKTYYLPQVLAGDGPDSHFLVDPSKSFFSIFQWDQFAKIRQHALNQ